MFFFFPKDCLYSFLGANFGVYVYKFTFEEVMLMGNVGLRHCNFYGCDKEETRYYMVENC